MNNYSQADMAFKKLIDSMKQDGNTHPTVEEMAKAFDSIHDKNDTDDEDLVCIPLSRYEELLRSESEIDILCTLVESPYRQKLCQGDYGTLDEPLPTLQGIPRNPVGRHTL